MRLIFVRHGDPDYQHDCLTETGRQQAASTALRLHDEKIKAIYSSPMGRARETASFTAKDHGLDVQNLDFMHEIWWGDKDPDIEDSRKIPFEGHPWSIAYKALTSEPSYAGEKSWEEHPYFKNNICMDYFDRINTGIDNLLLQYGLKREGDFYRCVQENSDTIALFAHGGSGAILFSHLLAISFPIVLTTLPFGVCSVSIFAFDAMEGEMAIPRLELFNDMNHHSGHKLNFEM
ncbi:histidine phosphatase family protein [Butyrivibrio sp. INlla14]|uniref:histidine phosphatase family protein n=1 Tax=Butyrivibrio sp. INlla14 TaxID=1520808 RepID=UPI000876BCD7|nr:histidine phosphatase family protein [Butyrivibrio sp. INlla14]SCY52940.1 probable phosphoglycerate mutase [Butyrivibrio sp. INlla14]